MKLEQLLREVAVSMPLMSEEANAILRRIKRSIDRIELNSLAW